MRLIALFVLFSLFGSLTAQQDSITGQIIDESGNPLIGVTVIIEATPHGVVSDMEGRFLLTRRGGNDRVTLLFSSLGYLSERRQVSWNDEPITVTLKADEAILEEVIVVGYASVRKERKARSLRRGLEGRVAGVRTTGSWRNAEPENREQYNSITENRFVATAEERTSTVSTDVDRASYANVRRFLKQEQLPPADAVRSEEMINYFAYDDVPPQGSVPLAMNTEIGDCPWNAKNHLMRVSLRAPDIDRGQLPPSNLVFLIDVSGSMESPDKLGLVKQSLLMLTEELRPQDRVAIVVYAGAAGLVLPSTPANDRDKIEAALRGLTAGGSTAGGAGIRLAYDVAQEYFQPQGNNRVIIATDGDFNVGINSTDKLVSLIEKKRKSGVYLTVLGFGQGNYQEGMMQELADRGNGNHAYIDGVAEARKVLVEEFGGTLFTVAKDVKLQIEFDPNVVDSFRLVGYENRLLDAEDFDDDTKDAGEIGAGHRVTVLYELSLKDGVSRNASPGELRLRYKDPKGGRSQKKVRAIEGLNTDEVRPSENLLWAGITAEFAMRLRKSPYLKTGDWSTCIERANANTGEDAHGYRQEMIHLMEIARKLSELN